MLWFPFEWLSHLFAVRQFYVKLRHFTLVMNGRIMGRLLFCLILYIILCLRLFTPIISVHPHCADKSCCNVMWHHALSMYAKEDYTVPVKGTAALHARKACVLHAHYTQCPCIVHAPYTQMHENACNCTRVKSRSRHDIACKITRRRSTGTQLVRVMRTKY